MIDYINLYESGKKSGKIFVCGKQHLQEGPVAIYEFLDENEPTPITSASPRRLTRTSNQTIG
jgi:hypothetical protein